MEHNRTNKAEWREFLTRTDDLTKDEMARREEIIEYLVDALEAATRGGDFSSSIYHLAEKYGGQSRDIR